MRGRDRGRATATCSITPKQWPISHGCLHLQRGHLMHWPSRHREQRQRHWQHREPELSLLSLAPPAFRTPSAFRTPTRPHMYAYHFFLARRLGRLPGIGHMAPRAGKHEGHMGLRAGGSIHSWHTRRESLARLATELGERGSTALQRRVAPQRHRGLHGRRGLQRCRRLSRRRLSVGAGALPA